MLDGVPRETRAKLVLYADALQRWQQVTNLVGPRTLDQVWTRHFADSLQVAEMADGDVWADLGSGAGFPGLVVAIARPERHVHLVESDSRRCAFLRHVARLTSANVTVHDSRVEAVLPRLEPRPTVITARAFAPLPKLLAFCEPVLHGDVVGLFPKGRDHARELTDARLSWTFDVDLLPSRIDQDGCVLRIRHLARVRDTGGDTT